jgi:hypothetical protein
MPCPPRMVSVPIFNLPYVPDKFIRSIVELDKRQTPGLPGLPIPGGQPIPGLSSLKLCDVNGDCPTATTPVRVWAQTLPLCLCVPTNLLGGL